jgi:hypothetical protein
MIEVVHDLDEFKDVLRGGCRLRYQILTNLETFGGIIRNVEVVFEVYGIAKEGHIIKFVDSTILENKKLKKVEDFQEDILRCIEQYDKLAEEIGATRGRYDE